MPVSKAQQKAQNKWIKKTYDRINLTVTKGRKDIIQSHAEAQGESVNGFINRAIDEAMERDKGQTFTAEQLNLHIQETPQDAIEDGEPIVLPWDEPERNQQKRKPIRFGNNNA